MFKTPNLCISSIIIVHSQQLLITNSRHPFIHHVMSKSSKLLQIRQLKIIMHQCSKQNSSANVIVSTIKYQYFPLIQQYAKFNIWVIQIFIYLQLQLYISFDQTCYYQFKHQSSKSNQGRVIFIPFDNYFSLLNHPSFSSSL